MAAKFILGSHLLLLGNNNKIMQMKSILLSEDIIRAINEEQGISNELMNKINDVYYGLLDDIAQNKNNVITQMNGVKRKDGRYCYDDFFGKPVYVNYVCYNFVNRQCFEYYFPTLPYYCQISANNVADVIVYFVSGRVYGRTLLNDLAHELTHAFHQNKTKKVFASSNVYQTAIKLKDDKSKSKMDRCIGRTIYLSYKFEHDAYFHSLYSNLMSCDTLSSFEPTLLNSDIYRLLEILKENLKIIKNVRYIPTELKSLGYNYGKLIRSCNKAVENIQWKIARVYNKATEDFRRINAVEEKEIFSNPLDFENI